MRRTVGVTPCLRLLSILCSLYLVFTKTETETTPSSYTLTVTTGEALREAFLHPNVTVILLGHDISLHQATWESGKHSDSESGIIIRRNLTLASHPSLEAPAILYLDYMEDRVLADEGTLLRINGVVLTGVSNDAQSFFFIPFFRFRPGGIVFIENSQFQMAIDPVNLWPLDVYPSKMNSTARANGYDWPVEARVFSRKLCEKHSLREVSCKDGAIWVESLSARLTVFDQSVEPEGKASFLAKYVLMIAQVFSEGRTPDVGPMTVSTPKEFKNALHNPAVKEIRILNDLSLTEDLFPHSVRTPITRNLTIASDPKLERSAVIDFNYLQSAIVAGDGVEIKLSKLNFTRVSKNPLDFELVPFFSLRPGAIYTYRDVISEMAISPDDLYPLNQLPYALYGGDVTEEYAHVQNNVKAVSQRWCLKDGRITCPDGALWIVRGIRRLDVLDIYNQEVLGHGFMDSENTLIKVIDMTKQRLKQDVQDYEHEYAIDDKGTIDDLSETTSQTIEDNSETHDLDSAEEDEADRKSFGFIGGFDPWILIYALVAAAMILGCCLLIVIIRRRIDHKKFKKVPTSKTTDTPGEDDDGIDLHQRVARQLLGDVKLGTLLGCGSFGRVYKAMWSGAQVAVKVILHQEDEAEVEQEAQFSISLRHPNVVQTFHYAVRTVDNKTPTPKNMTAPKGTLVSISCNTEAVKDPISLGMSIPSSWMQTSGGGKMFVGSSSLASAESSVIRTEDKSVEYQEELWLEMWLIQEFCNLGSLGKQNYLRLNDQHSAWGCKHPAMNVIIDTCKDIARGMKYLHDNGIVHGDLKCDNLLLQSSHVDPKGFTAKVADFGLSRKLGPSTHLSTKSFGTITHMPPELLMDGHLSSKVDVYSFGVIMWELMTGMTPFRDLRYAEVMRAIVAEDRRPSFSSDTPEDYVTLAKLCWDKDPSKRPPFDRVLSELDRMTEKQFASMSSSWSGDSDASSNKGYST